MKHTLCIFFAAAMFVLTPGHSLLLAKLPLGTATRKRFNVFFSARNGSFSQLLRMAVVDGSWRSATRVIRDEKTVFEEADDDFPRDEAGEIAW